MIRSKKSSHIKQIVYISNRPQELAETLKHVRKYMTFLKKYTIFCPGNQIYEFAALCPDCEIIDEESLLGEHNQYFSELKSNFTLNHDRINYLLRSCLAYSEFVDDLFIMSDDDYRPLSIVDESYYYNRASDVYNAYFMTSLEFYIGFIEQRRDPNIRNSAFHNVQYDMLKTFRRLGIPTLMYASHMPQLINKTIFRESVEYFKQNADGYSLDEWSSYFNFATHYYPNKFNQKLYETMCWPHLNFGLAIPNDFKFELIYQSDVIASPYLTSKIFAGIPEQFTPYQDKVNEEKIIRYRRALNRYYSGVKIYLGKDLDLGKSSQIVGKSTARCAGESGECATFGPYARIPRGRYVANLRFKMNHVSNLPYFEVDVCHGSGSVAIVERTCISIDNAQPVDGNEYHAVIKFDVDRLVSDLEVRTYFSESENSFDIKSIEIASAD